MRKWPAVFLIKFVLLAMPFMGHGQYFNELYEPGGSSNNAHSIIQADSFYYTLGSGSDTGMFPFRLQLAKIDLHGNLKGARFYGASNQNYHPGYFKSMAVYQDSLIVAAGSRVLNGEPDWCLFVFNQELDSIKFIPSNWPNSDRFINMQVTPDGGIICTGYVEDTANSSGDLLLTKFDAQLNLEWSKAIGSAKSQRGISVDTTLDGGYIIGAYDQVGGKFLNTFMKCDSAGNLEWQEHVGSPMGAGYLYAIATSDNGYVGVSSWPDSVDNSFSWGYHYAVKMDSAGNILWEKTYSGRKQYQALYSVQETAEEEFIAVGIINGGMRLYDGVAFKFNGKGDSIWARSLNKYYSFSYSYELYDFVQTKDKGIVAAGSFVPGDVDTPYVKSNRAIWALKLDSLGCYEPDCDTFCQTPIKAGFEYEILPDLKVSFKDTSTGGAKSWFWAYYGDPFTSPGYEATDTVQFSSPGTYIVELHVENRCTDYDWVSKEIKVYTVGHEKTDPYHFIKAYPNPVKDQMQVEYSFKEAGFSNCTLRLTDLLGRQHGQEELHEISGTTSVNVKGLPTGIYLLSIAQEGQVVWQQKVQVVR